MRLEVDEFSKWLLTRETADRKPFETEKSPSLSVLTLRLLIELKMIKSGYTKAEVDQMSDFDVMSRAVVLDLYGMMEKMKWQTTRSPTK